MHSVDVVIPCYKYAHFLEECVGSVLSQAGVDVRVLILDDCSPDNTPEVGMALAS
ncbi:glycosyltransferase family 2 protein, partial [Rhizobium ruizarguesonis]